MKNPVEPQRSARTDSGDFYGLDSRPPPMPGPVVPPPPPPEYVNAKDFLQSAINEMLAREDLYDQPGGERSMPAIVTMFNVLTGHELSITQGWKFMAILKMVRSEYNGYRMDDYVDGAAFTSLAGESASKGE